MSDATPWPPLRLLTLLNFMHTPFSNLADLRSATAIAFLRGHVADGLLRALPGAPYYAITGKGVEVCRRILTASAAIRDRVNKASVDFETRGVKLAPGEFWVSRAVFEKYGDDLIRKLNGADACEQDPNLKEGKPFVSFTLAQSRLVAGEDIEKAQVVTVDEQTGFVMRARPPEPEKKREPEWLAALSPVKRRAWDTRYRRWKETGTALHGRGVVTRTQWRHLFDIIFARTDKLRDLRTHLALRDAFWYAMRRDQKPTFDSLRRIALDSTLFNSMEGEDDDA